CRASAVARPADGPRQGRAARSVRPLDRCARVANSRGDRRRSEETAPDSYGARGRVCVRQGAGPVKRLYLQIYLTVVASLVAFVTAAGVLWWMYIDQLAPRHPMDVISEAAQALPAEDAPLAQQQEGINRLALRLRGDAALYARD